MVIFLYRPSPQIPEPSLKAARTCYEASIHNVHVQRQQLASKAVDLTWIFTQTLFMALNTVLWTLSYPELRQENPKHVVEGHLKVALDGIGLCSERWPGVVSAMQIYANLVTACLKAYDGDVSFVVPSPSNNASPTPPPDYPTPSSLTGSSGPTPTSNNTILTPQYSEFPLDPFQSLPDATYGQQPLISPSYPPDTASSIPVPSRPWYESQPSSQGFPPNSETHPPMSMQPSVYGPPPTSHPTQSGPSYDPRFPANSYDVASYNKPQRGTAHWNPSYAPRSAPPMASQATPTSNPPVSSHFNPWMGPFDEQWSQYMHGPLLQPQPQGLPSLNLQQQSELMQNLESCGMPDVYHPTPRNMTTSSDYTNPFF